MDEVTATLIACPYTYLRCTSPTSEPASWALNADQAGESDMTVVLFQLGGDSLAAMPVAILIDAYLLE